MKSRRTLSIPLLTIVAMLSLLASCAGGISREARARITYTGGFDHLREDVDAYKGEVVMLGGKIIKTFTSETVSEIAVLELPLDSSDRPRQSDGSGGRFLIRTKEFLDPAVYREGALLTVVGSVVDKETRPVGEFPFIYPVIEPVEIRIWREYRDYHDYPTFHLGIGIGTRF